MDDLDFIKKNAGILTEALTEGKDGVTLPLDVIEVIYPILQKEYEAAAEGSYDESALELAIEIIEQH